MNKLWLEIFYKAMDRQWGTKDEKDVDAAIKEANKIYKALKESA